MRKITHESITAIAQKTWLAFLRRRGGIMYLTTFKILYNTPLLREISRLLCTFDVWQNGEVVLESEIIMHSGKKPRATDIKKIIEVFKQEGIGDRDILKMEFVSTKKEDEM